VSDLHQNRQEGIDAPRRVTAVGARRAWGDLRVRVWWLCALVLATAMFMIAGSRIAANLRERDVIKNGTQVTAVVVGLDGSTRLGWSQPRTDSHEVRLRVKMPDGQNLTLAGTLPAGSGNVKIGEPIEIKVDPNQTSRWTDRTEALSWPAELVVPLSFLPFVLLLIGGAFWRRAQVLRIWRTGQAVEGIVHDVRHTAMAPRSRLVRYTIPELSNHRIFSTLIPTHLGILQAGDPIGLVAVPHAPQRSVAAVLYEQ
jgi:hypothetical protein